jgi:hypothetical protein
MQGRRAEGQHRDPFSPILGDIAQHPANGVGLAQVVFLMEQFVVRGTRPPGKSPLPSRTTPVCCLAWTGRKQPPS